MEQKQEGKKKKNHDPIQNDYLLSFYSRFPQSIGKYCPNESGSCKNGSIYNVNGLDLSKVAPHT